MVAVCGAEFAGARAAGGSIRLLDGATEVSARDLVHAQLKAALLACEHAGAIRLVVSESSVLRVEPTGVRASWPAPSTEARLDLEFARDVSEIVGRWAAEPSSHPWVRAAEKTYAAMVLRGAAAVGQQGRERRYRLADGGLEAAARRDAAGVAELLRRCEAERPQIFRLLSKAIEAGVHCPGEGKLYVQMDPWYDEAAADVARVPGLQLRGNVKTWRSHPVTVAFVISAVIAIVVFMSTHGKWLPAKNSTAGNRNTATNPDWMVWASLALMAILGAASLLRTRAGKAITEFVVKQPEPPSAEKAEGAAGVRVGAGGAAAVRAPVVLPFDIEILKAPALPPPSESARKRIEAIHERGPAVKRLYRSSALWLFVGSIALALFTWRAPFVFTLAFPASALCVFYFNTANGPIR